MGGENRSRPAKRYSLRGSSPRGRGKLGARPAGAGSPRLIPAWAGKTAFIISVLKARGAHPRVGGENMVTAYNTRTRVGSSPRGRGKPTTPKGTPMNRGLIPAWAGKTLTIRRASTAHEAHPRVGGENSPTSRPQAHPRGSSPRGRGKRCGTRARGQARRLIPAWAGKTQARRGLNAAAGAHPRVGGENDVRFNALAFDGGSSPRGRGKPPALR